MPLPLPTIQSNPLELKQSATSFASASAPSFAPGLSPAVKMTIKEEGWYRVTQQELVAAGFDAKIDPRGLRVFVEGAEQAILVRGEQDRSFDVGDAVEFFATGQDSAFTDAHVYWLVSGEGFGSRISAVKSKVAPSGPRSFSYTAERRDRTIYFSSLKNGEAENFFGAVISSQLVEESVVIRHLDMKSSGPAEVEIALQGVTDLRGEGPDHQVSVRLNGAEIGKLIFDGQVNKVEKFAVKPGLLMEGENVISLESERGGNDISLVDYMRVTYGHRYTSDEDSLRMTVPLGVSQTITGFTSAKIRVVDITDPAGVKELTGTVQRQEDGYAVTVNVGGQGTRTLLALTEDRVKRPARITLDRASTWRSESNEADLLIISRREFFTRLEALKRLRETQGLRVALIDIEDVYDEFSYGEKTPQAVKDLISYASTRWRVKPTFVLMGGDASVDGKNYLGFGDKDVVPTKLVDTALMETASDEWFGDKDGDGVAELAVGRLPFGTADEAVTMVSKILTYEATRGAGEALLVSDRNDEFDFERASGEILELIPATVKVSELRRGRVDGAKAKMELMEAMNRGQKLVNYMGHGSANKWNGDLLTNEEARGLKNGDKLPMFVMMTCLNGYFADAAGESLAESLMKSELGGAVAVWASSGVTSPGSQVAIDRELYRLLFSGSERVTLGEAVKRAKRVASDPDIRRTWVLLGDPAMRLK